MPIRIIITGGTIDNLEYASPQQAPRNHRSLIPELLNKARITTNYVVTELMQKDSRFIDDSAREVICKECREVSEKQIVITHGTLTMTDTAKYLSAQNLPKTVVLTGAAIPANQDESDALFNLGTAVSAVQILPPGVYITMNGRIFTADNVRKDFDKGIFVENIKNTSGH